jgi:hypothetical protein
VTALVASWNNSIGPVRNNFGFTGTDSQRTGTQEAGSGADRARLLSYFSTHQLDVSEYMSFNANVQVSDNSLRYGNGSLNGGARYWQLNTYGTWMPEFEDLDDLPMTVTAGLRASGSQNENGEQSFSASNYGGNLGASYRFNNNLLGTANFAATQVNTSRSPAQLFTQYAVSGNYTGDVINFGDYSYSWGIGASAQYLMASGATEAIAFKNQTTYGFNASQSLGRSWMFEDQSSLGAYLSQTLTNIQTTGFGQTNSLSNTISGNYGFSLGEGANAGLTSSASYTVTTGDFPLDYTTFSLGANASGQLSQTSSIGASITGTYNSQAVPVQAAFGGGTVTTQQSTVVGSAVYQNQRALWTRGLRYRLEFNVDTRLIDTRLQGNVAGLTDPFRWSLLNQFEYRLGKLDFRLSATVSEYSGSKNALVFFQVYRQLGNY